MVPQKKRGDAEKAAAIIVVIDNALEAIAITFGKSSCWCRNHANGSKHSDCHETGPPSKYERWDHG